MADSILDNQEVTAEILNDIAIDLGHTSFNGFGEDKFGADTLNAITGNLVGAGILSSYNKCKPTIQSDKVYIDTGIIVFNNGAKKKITENGIYVDLINSSYIYALNNTVTNTCSIIVSQTEPVDGDFVNIARIGEDGTLIDRRKIAKAKVELPTEGNSYYKSKLITSENELYHGARLFTLSTEGISKIFIVCGSRGRWIYDVNTSSASGVYNYNGEYKYGDNSNGMYIYWLAGTPRAIITLTANNKNDNSITFSLGVNGTSGGLMSAIDFLKNNPIEFYAFGGVEQ